MKNISKIDLEKNQLNVRTNRRNCYKLKCLGERIFYQKEFAMTIGGEWGRKKYRTGSFTKYLSA